MCTNGNTCKREGTENTFNMWTISSRPQGNLANFYRFCSRCATLDAESLQWDLIVLVLISNMWPSDCWCDDGIALTHRDACFFFFLFFSNTNREIHPEGLPPSYTIILLFRLLPDTGSEAFDIWQIADKNNNPEVGVTVNRKPLIVFCCSAVVYSTKKSVESYWNNYADWLKSISLNLILILALAWHLYNNKKPSFLTKYLLQICTSTRGKYMLTITGMDLIPPSSLLIPLLATMCSV